jgi:uncharacterized LabA/DUF88 family protein
MMSDKACVFIDGGYLFKVQRDLGLRSLDLLRLSSDIVGNYQRMRTYFYDADPYQSNPPTTDEKERLRKKQGFFDRLNRLDNFEVRKGYLRLKGTDASSGNKIFEQKGVDVKLAVDLLRLSLRGGIQLACLIAGDGDFVPIVEIAKDAGVEVRLYYGNGANSKYSQQLWDCCDQRTLMDRAFLSKFQLP